jgi:hypothetical protein
MAKIILGATVTAIVGSINGNTFKRTPYGFSLGRKSLGYSRNKLLNNQALGWLAQVRNDWKNLTFAEKEAWNEKALKVQFPDKFGNLINITGRMLFIKSWGTLIQSGSTIKSAAVFNTNIDFFSLTTNVIDIGIDKVEFDITSSSQGQWYYFQLQRVRDKLQPPSFTRRFICSRQYYSGDRVIDLFTEMKEQFGKLNAGDWYRIYVTPVNDGGYAGTPISINFELQ